MSAVHLRACLISGEPRLLTAVMPIASMSMQRRAPNTGWRNISFRGHADCLPTSVFQESLARCIGLAKCERVALATFRGHPLEDTRPLTEASGDSSHRGLPRDFVSTPRRQSLEPCRPAYRKADEAMDARCYREPA